ncbi:MAG: cell cycle inhibitor [Lasallia pustulata]|uniref:Cell cycle inhibitor n=1 Tax=Lasallia pustulata TaxID=136370 RepID=A0A5M8Q533_9LECA|nr:MAG: cell cycle inhibitor [Lasallia pustulata]
MVERPELIDHRSKSEYPAPPSMPSSRQLPSPRIMHNAGDVPPAMSPLDAFAAHSRLLAKQLEDSQNNGRRVSRLAPHTIANSFARSMPTFHPSKSTEDEIRGYVPPQRPKELGTFGNNLKVEEPAFRPASFYPRMSSITPGDHRQGLPLPPSVNSQTDYPTPSYNKQPALANDYLSAHRAQSPEPLVTRRGNVEANERAADAQSIRSYNYTHHKANSQSSFNASYPRARPQRGLSNDSASSRGQYPNALAPPGSPHVRHKTSIRSIPADSSDDDYTTSTNGSSFSQPRKLSSSSGMSIPHSPMSPYAQPHNRSPSLNSEISMGGTHIPRPAFNFSRPLSRGSRPSVDLPSRQPSSDSQRYIFADDTVHTPVSTENDESFDSKDHRPTATPTYVYTKFSLPRGRLLQRDSMVLENTDVPVFSWDQPVPQSNVTPATPPNEPISTAPSAPPPRPEQPGEVRPITPDHNLPLRSRSRPSRPNPTPLVAGRSHTSSASLNSASTVRARSYQDRDLSVEVTAEDHLNKGIECHERGSLKESTYHLRLAARENHPTAMLLYALACRHGWGMRPNQQEGVQWLRKAADSASLEIAGDEDLAKEGKPTDLLERKTRRAQFALSIYELGVSHMNGWGIEQDKVLALRCFEIAANWGDTDAMAEAGFCYYQGQGCRKDMKKAARFYRMAEAKGMSMVGNSWIYKPKYADVAEDRQSPSANSGAAEKKSWDKSRTRTIFGRKKSVSGR